VRRGRKHRVSAPMAVGPARSPSVAKPRATAGLLLTSLPLGIFWFVALAAPILLGTFLAAVWLVVMGITLALLRWTGKLHWQILFCGLALICAPVTSLAVRGTQLERRRVARSLGFPIPSPYRPLPRGPTLARVQARAGDPAVWRDLTYLLLLLPVGVIEFAVVVAAFVFLIGTITLPLWLFVAFPEGAPLWQDLRIDTLSEALIVAVVALPVCALAAYLMVIGVSQAHAALGRALLRPSRTARLAERIEELTESRSRALAATLAERRRIERDLHDGAQQRLVSLAMELGMAKEKLAEDPEAARKLVEEAHGEAKLALDEIRDLVQGIYPAVLGDRGLDAAISALAGRCPVPVEVEVELDRRPSEAAETTAYFVVAEALANVAKHSGASEAHVAVWREREDWLVVEVTDDGKGGADPESGTGFGGLADRLAALDGRLFVESPAGGPTRVRAELPLGSPDGTVP
jgi:signal transduction histidine kinase